MRKIAKMMRMIIGTEREERNEGFDMVFLWLMDVSVAKNIYYSIIYTYIICVCAHVYLKIISIFFCCC